jgi:hypothetical protein
MTLGVRTSVEDNEAEVNLTVEAFRDALVGIAALGARGHEFRTVAGARLLRFAPLLHFDLEY